MKGLNLKGINKTYGKIKAVEDVSQEIHSGEFFTLLGPSGCGKTTLLRMIAGLELQDSGQIILEGEDITGLPAIKRQINTVFQSYALFPHLNIFENVAFGLRSRKVPGAEVDKRVKKTLEMLELGQMTKRFPHQLSGGQNQRVALARALVNEPKILLLDEPMSALDAKLRAQVQVELRRLQQKLGQTFILVTHDQDEALVVSDRIAVMKEGKIVQFGTPMEVYEFPKNKFVAEFLGTANLIEGTYRDGLFHTDLGTFELEKPPAWEKGLIAIRPEWIRISDTKPDKNGIRATVTEMIYRGTNLDIWLNPGPIRLRTSTYKNIKIGDELWLDMAPKEMAVLNE
ncbi:MAG: ABC transporter ATP-binding protein [Proteobacteria bacterium]|nr:ABC transporter ATP-binding protein [Pseudomonadota bacterium]MBU1582263.1 ABC transporter ATP-binding protein [Pseudomonadota bacterium]MBU2632035.1 ABC transporter ATP-binding protein [Pseudomonadota bacterium]